MVHLVSHPLLQDALADLRDKDASPEAFRRQARRAALLLGTEALRDLPSEHGTVATPLGPAVSRRVRRDVIIVPVLRAGLAMVEPMLELMPTARVGHIGLQRDEETAVASRYYSRMPPDCGDSLVLLVDPMLATGGSALAALDLLAASGARDVRIVCIVAAPEGIAAVERRYPQVPIYTPVVDRELNAQKFIVPGLGDFGDRLYGTM